MRRVPRGGPAASHDVRKTVLRFVMATPERVLMRRTERTAALEFDHERNAMGAFGSVADVYFGGDLESGIALSGQVAGRIQERRPVADIIRDCAEGCEATLAALSARYVTA